VDFKEFDLDDIVKRYPLDAGMVDEVISKKQVAAGFSVSTNTIDKWLEAGLPFLEKGSNGQTYEFQLSHCWAWFHARNDAEKNASEAQSNAVRALQLALTGGASGSGIDALTPKEKREVFETQMAWEAFQRERGELIDRANVVSLLDQMFVLIRDTVTTLPDRLERDCQIEGETIEKAFVVCDELLVETQKQISDFFEKNDKPKTKERRDLLDA